MFRVFLLGVGSSRDPKGPTPWLSSLGVFVGASIPFSTRYSGVEIG